MSSGTGFAEALFLGKCRNCKRKRRLHAPVVEVTIVTKGPGVTERVYWREVNGSRVKGYDAIVVLCSCRVPVEFRLLRGTFSASETCSSRCTGSTGPACSCSCGGKNHGAAHH